MNCIWESVVRCFDRAIDWQVDDALPSARHRLAPSREAPTQAHGFVGSFGALSPIEALSCTASFGSRRLDARALCTLGEGLQRPQKRLGCRRGGASYAPSSSNHVFNAALLSAYTNAVAEMQQFGEGKHCLESFALRHASREVERFGLSDDRRVFDVLLTSLEQSRAAENQAED